MTAQHQELSSNVVAFCRLLRDDGLPIGLSEETDAMSALGSIHIEEPEEFRLTLRTILARNRKEQERFDRLFESYWCGKLLSDSTHLGLRKKISFQTPKQSLLNPVLKNWNEGVDKQEEGLSGYSPLELLKRKDFSSIKDEDFKETIETVNKLKKVLSTPRSLRFRKSLRHHLIDFRKTMRLSLRNAGEVIEVAYKERAPRPMNLVLLCDVSGSMENYSKFLISIIYSLQSVYNRIETFVFSTALTRLTAIIKRKSLKQVLQEMSDSVPDWSGGTRIGECFQDLLELHSDKVTKNTVVMILSDGWDVGDVDLLEQSMKTIHSKAKRVIWLNPLLGSSEYEPSCLGMQRALPYIDDFLPANNVQSLRDLCNHLSNTNLLRRKMA
ncbi:VWA domain-containing protein [bacterium]|nr:VWA domain-containing protein [bacterium]